MKRYLLFYLVILILLLIFFYSDKKDYTYLIHEEATPIRDLDEIKGMFYRIDIDKSINDKSLDVSSSIISSINHFKDISNIDNFFVNLEVDDSYKVDDISIVDKNNFIIRYINFDKDSNDVVLNLEKDDFVNYNNNYDIRIKLKRNTRKI
jgi:hypothetical protein